MEIKTESQEITELKEPKKYKVFLLNDDYTTMDFVVDVLCEIFHKTYEEAVNIMLKIHKEGKGLCGVYTYEIAETKVDQVHRLARAHEFPLKATMEEE
ncbi:ATP-dependent Clp protease adapter ClpS [Nitratiruptor sp. YY09-18]|uniref:ATP-dependent Clp protease adapter ClpS n=1 Tax=Nitratiruptor sp. YY09-18 TaxID=2724901 RepID=UPI001914DB43|nr:ATP-dependent Clp protease adapter ClpS [Nitratiruptor sp. YY09-18]BCD67533.1 ATP-dependent Clp protease adaptor protein ClpS [Nitratiruptor sp. YY09-18]